MIFMKTCTFIWNKSNKWHAETKVICRPSPRLCYKSPSCVCAQSSPTLCSSMDCSSPGCSVHVVFQARILEWVAISSSRGSSRPRNQTCISCVSCIAGGFLTTWTLSESPTRFKSGIDGYWRGGLDNRKWCKVSFRCIRRRTVQA